MAGDQRLLLAVEIIHCVRCRTAGHAQARPGVALAPAHPQVRLDPAAMGERDERVVVQATVARTCASAYTAATGPNSWIAWSTQVAAEVPQGAAAGRPPDPGRG